MDDGYVGKGLAAGTVRRPCLQVRTTRDERTNPDWPTSRLVVCLVGTAAFVRSFFSRAIKTSAEWSGQFEGPLGTQSQGLHIVGQIHLKSDESSADGEKKQCLTTH